MRKLAVAVFVWCLFIPNVAHAYVGPGLGLGAIGVVLGFLLSVFLAVVGLFWYPIKRLIRRFKGKPPAAETPPEDAANEPPNESDGAG